MFHLQTVKRTQLRIKAATFRKLFDGTWHCIVSTTTNQSLESSQARIHEEILALSIYASVFSATSCNTPSYTHVSHHSFIILHVFSCFILCAHVFACVFSCWPVKTSTSFHSIAKFCVPSPVSEVSTIVPSLALKISTLGGRSFAEESNTKRCVLRCVEAVKAPKPWF